MEVGYVEDTARGRLVGWMNEIIKKISSRFDFVDQQLIFKQNGKTKKFPDIVIWERRGQRIACLIELKTPEGWTPYDPVLINDAKGKCMDYHPNIEYYGTWNINELVLWQTFDRDATSYLDTRKARYEITNIKELRQLDSIEIEANIKTELESFLKDFEQIYFEKRAIPKLPIDWFFIYALQSAVNAFYYPILTHLKTTFVKDKKFSKELMKWFVEQGWLPPAPDDEEAFEKTARQFLYLFMDKILFYNTLRINYKRLNQIKLSDKITQLEEFRKEIQKYFDEAEIVSEDYETIFTENFIETIPLPESIIPSLVYFVNGFAKHDFSLLEFKDIGRIYDGLIPANERHKLGQYFTRDDIVDLILGFCVNNPDSKIADFGCGAGTFLVRAYARLKNLNPKKSHDELLKQLLGVDIAKFPAHLSTINLARRELKNTQNYPRIIHNDFFNITLGSKFFHGPKSFKVKKLNKTSTEEEITTLNAVVGNPPYIRQEKLEEVKEGYKEKLANLIKEDWNTEFKVGERADIYIYFFLHGIKFLEDKGRFGYITSNAWLDVDYGKYLQEFLLKKTKIVAIIESKVERWFTDAAINTAIVILERCSNEEERENNLVKFVQLKVPLQTVIKPTDNERERWSEVEKLIKIIEKADKFLDDSKIRIYPKKQSELWDEGYDGDEGKYIGSKWVKYVRAPDIFYTILKKGENFLCQIKQGVGKVRFGIKSGVVEFFFLTEEQIKKLGIEKEFWMHKEDGKWVPNFIMKSPRESKEVVLSSQRTEYRVLIINKSRKDLAGTNVLKYIKWGEEQGFDKRPTCASRQKWYDLGVRENPLLTKGLFTNDLFITHLNPDRIFVNDVLLELHTPEKTANLVCAIMNSTVLSLFMELHGRVALGEGVLKIQTYEYGTLPIVNPDKIPKTIQHKILETFENLKSRQIQSVFEEIGAKSPEEVTLDKVKKDRRELDKIIMGDILGLEKEEQLDVYKAVIDLVKSRIERAQSVKTIKKVRGVNISGLADSLLAHLNVPKLRFPDDYVDKKEKGEVKELPKGFAEIDGDLHGFFVKVDNEKMRCKSQDEAKFLFYSIVNRKEKVTIPHDKKILADSIKGYAKVYKGFVINLKKSLESTIPDKKIRKQVASEVFKKIFEGSNGK